MEMNIFAPIPAPIHIIFCIFATIFFAYMIIKYKRIYHIFLTIAIDVTLLTQLIDKYEYIQILGYIEIALCITTLFFYFKQKKDMDNIKQVDNNDDEQDRIINESHEIFKHSFLDDEQGE